MKHADTFESTLRDHTHLQDTSEMMAARTSQYKRQFKSPIKATPCIGCGSSCHSSRDCSIKCPAWGKHCQNCNTLNHFAKVCCRKTYESAEALLTHVSFSQKRGLPVEGSHSNTSLTLSSPSKLACFSRTTRRGIMLNAISRES